jgi:hypothetical protein
MRYFRIGSALFLGAALAATAPARLHAQHAASHTLTADDRALLSYTLTMDKLRKVKQAALNLAAFVKAHPDAEKRYGDLSNDDAKTFDDQIRQIESIPPFKQAIVAAGLTPRDYLLTSMTFFQAGLTAAMQDAAVKANQKVPALPYNVNPANVSFVRAHKAEIEQLKLGEEMAAADSSGDSNQL